MARYYFDIHATGTLLRDGEGLECDGPAAIRAEAMHALPEIAKNAIPRKGDNQAFTVVVRNANHVTVYTASLTFAGLWLGDTPIPERDEVSLTRM